MVLPEAQKIKAPVPAWKKGASLLSDPSGWKRFRKMPTALTPGPVPSDTGGRDQSHHLYYGTR